jgi:hypothetical protein
MELSSPCIELDGTNGCTFHSQKSAVAGNAKKESMNQVCDIPIDSSHAQSVAAVYRPHSTLF